MFGIATENDKLTLTEKEFQRVSDMVYKHCGINLHDGKKELVRSRLAKLLRLKNIETYTEYLDMVSSDTNGDELTEMIDSISTNLTSFFRESDHFDFLKNRFLPEMLEQKQKCGDKRIRAWSAGCSSGEEPYTIAITLMDSIPNAESWDIKILATDISTRILKRATEGVYDSDRIAPVPGNLKHRFLTRKKQNNQTLYEVTQQLKSKITFKYLNLMNEFPFKGPFDFIFCRNVMIYFDKQTQERLINRYYNLLAPGGVLFTGHSESLTGVRHKFTYVQPTIYKKG